MNTSFIRHGVFPAAAVVAGASALGSLFGGIFTNKSNREAQERANQENMAFQREMFNRKAAREDMLNANSALIQRQSLEKAGLNPNVGQYGQLQTGVAQGSPSSSAYIAQSPFDGAQMGALAQLLQQQPLVDAQAENIRADTLKKNAETNNINVDSILKETQNWSLRQKTPAEVKNLEQNTDLLHEEMNRVKWDSKQIEANIELIKSKQANIDVDTNFLLDTYDTRIGQLVATVSELQSRNQLNIAEAAVAYKSIEVMSHQIRDIESRISLNQKQWLYLDSEITNLCIDGDFKQFEYNIKKKFGDATAAAILENINEETLNLRSEEHWRPVSVVVGAAASAASAVGVSAGGVATGLNQGSKFVQGLRKRPMVLFIQ